jgi:TatD DNase family protein
MLIDAHCHIDRYPDPMRVANRAETDGILTVAVTNLPSHYQIGSQHATRLRHVCLALGLHPLVAGQHRGEVQLFRRLAPSVSFVGEVGLDFSREGKGTATAQIEVFREILLALGRRPVFITLHSRQAESKVLEMLAEFGVGPAVFHWFTGSPGHLVEAARAGHYFSVNPAMVGSAKGRSLIELMPQDRVLTETDGPYVKLGTRAAEPHDVRAVVSHLSQVWGRTEPETEELIVTNYCSLLRIGAPPGTPIDPRNAPQSA